MEGRGMTDRTEKSARNRLDALAALAIAVALIALALLPAAHA
jgi:hypothetical protein